MEKMKPETTPRFSDELIDRLASEMFGSDKKHSKISRRAGAINALRSIERIGGRIVFDGR